MKFAIHKINPDGSPGDRMTRKVGDNESPFFADEESANVHLLECLRLGTAKGEYHDYMLCPYDDAGIMLERVQDADAHQASLDAEWLAKNNDDVNMAVSTMLVARQIYAVAVKEMERLLSKIARVGDETRPPHPMVGEFLIQAAGAQAQKAFNEQHLFAGLNNIALPWLHKIISEHVKEDQEAQVKEANEKETARRACKVPVGFATETGGPCTIEHGMPILLVGYGPAVRWLLDQAVNAALVARDEAHPVKAFSVLRLCQGEAATLESEQPRLVRISREHWQSCGYTKKRLQPLMTDFILPWMKASQAMIDLMVVDDLAGTATQPSAGLVAAGKRHYGGGNAPFLVNDGLKRMAEFCRYTGMALLAGVPTTSPKLEDLTGSAWEIIRVHSILRPVQVLREAPGLEAGKVRITVGINAWSTDVDAAVLEPKQPQIIIP